MEYIVEALGWLRIVASPTLLGLGIGAVVYLNHPTAFTLINGISIAALGLTIGVLWATRVWKTKGTIWFLSRVMATPELDRPEKEE